MIAADGFAIDARERAFDLLYETDPKAVVAALENSLPRMGDVSWRRRVSQLVGERNGCSKLTNEQAQAIYNAMKRGEKAKDVAARHGVQPRQCRRILRGERWALVIKRNEQEDDQ